MTNENSSNSVYVLILGLDDSMQIDSDYIEYRILTKPKYYLVVNNDLGAAAITTNSADLRFIAACLGTNSTADVYLYWGSTDGDMIAGNWSNTNVISNVSLGNDSTNITTLVSNTTYYYRCWISNSTCCSAWACQRFFCHSSSVRRPS